MERNLEYSEITLHGKESGIFWNHSTWRGIWIILKLLYMERNLEYFEITLHGEESGIFWNRSTWRGIWNILKSLYMERNLEYSEITLHGEKYGILWIEKVIWGHYLRICMCEIKFQWSQVNNLLNFLHLIFSSVQFSSTVLLKES